MEKLSRAKLWNLEQYAERRQDFRTQVIDHKKVRRLALGPHATLIFEDFLSMKYQVQEMLRVERIFTGPEIEEEIAAYNPLIPDGSNWKATLLIEYPDVDERRAALGRMSGIEHRLWVEVGGQPRIFAMANEDMDRSTEDKTAAVHFLRYELPADTVNAALQGTAIRFGIDHPELDCSVEVPESTRLSLLQDLDGYDSTR